MAPPKPLYYLLLVTLLFASNAAAEGVLKRALNWAGLGAGEYRTSGVGGGWSLISRSGVYPRDFSLRTFAVIADEDHPFLVEAARALAIQLNEHPDIDSAVFYPPGGEGPQGGVLPDAWIHLHWEYLDESGSFFRRHLDGRLILYVSNAASISRQSSLGPFFYQADVSQIQSAQHSHTTRWGGGHRNAVNDFAEKTAKSLLASLGRLLKDGEMPSQLRDMTPEAIVEPAQPLIPLFEELEPWAVGTRPLADYYAIYKLDPARLGESIPHRVHLELAALGWHDVERFREGDSHYRWSNERQTITVSVEDPAIMVSSVTTPPPNRLYDPYVVIEHVIMMPDDKIKEKLTEQMSDESCPVDYLLTMWKYIDGDPELRERFHGLLLTTEENEPRIHLARADYWAEQNEPLHEWKALWEAAKRQFTQSGGPSALERLKTFSEERPGFTPPSDIPSLFEEMGAHPIPQGEFVVSATVGSVEPFILYQVEEDGSVNYVSTYVTVDRYTESYPGFGMNYIISGGSSGYSSGGITGFRMPWDEMYLMDERRNPLEWSVQTEALEDGRFRIEVKREAR